MRHGWPKCLVAPSAGRFPVRREFIAAPAGLGYIIMFASSAGETATVLAAIVVLCGIGLMLYGLVGLGELVKRWYGGEMPTGGVI